MGPLAAGLSPLVLTWYVGMDVTVASVRLRSCAHAGVRQDHAAAGRHLFLEDDDAWGLEALLQAGCMLQAGRAPLRRAPNDANVPQASRGSRTIAT